MQVTAVGTNEATLPPVTVRKPSAMVVVEFEKSGVSWRFLLASNAVDALIGTCPALGAIVTTGGTNVVVSVNVTVLLTV